MWTDDQINEVLSRLRELHSGHSPSLPYSQISQILSSLPSIFQKLDQIIQKVDQIAPGAFSQADRDALAQIRIHFQ